MAGFLVLIYQSVYYHWAFRSDVLAPGGMPIRSEECNFWWWQYLWLSLVASSVYFLESFLCWMPSVVSALMTWNNDIVQALLNILINAKSNTKTDILIMIHRFEYKLKKIVSSIWNYP